MNSLEKEFIPYELALEMKQLGFDEHCFARYGNDSKMLYKTYSNELHSNYHIPCPTFSQCFRWFREKHQLKGYIEPVEYLDNTPETYMWVVYDKCHSDAKQLTYEQAEQECLKQLIKIIKDGQQ